MLGLTQLGAVNQYTEETCKAACQQNSTCVRCDFNWYDVTCWLGSAGKTMDLRNNNVVNHWELTRCSSSCINTWTLSANKHVLGLSPFGTPGSLDESGCKSACEKNGSCFGVDYNTQDRSCWMGFVANPELSDGPSINHWDLKKCQPANQGQDLNQDCQNVWEQYPGSNSLGADYIPELTTIAQCTSACQNMTTCCGLDISALSNGGIECWLHFNVNDFKQLYSTAGRTQYRLHRCPQDSTTCIASFQQTQTNQYSSGGVAAGAATSLTSCQSACQRQVQGCVGVDFYSDQNQCSTLTASTLGKNLLPRTNSNEYAMTSACQNMCKPRWTMFKDVAGVSPLPAPVTLVGNIDVDFRICMDFCWNSNDCVGVEYTPGSSGSCKYYTASLQSNMLSRSAKTGTTQYQLVDRCNQSCPVYFAKVASARYTLVKPQTITTVTNANDCQNYCSMTYGCLVYQVTKSGAFSCTTGTDYVPGTSKSDNTVDTFFLQQGACMDSSITVASTPSTTTAPNVCVPNWSVTRGYNVLGLTQRGGKNDYTEETCKAACFADTSCNCIDFNTYDKTCFTGFFINPRTINNFVVNHWDLVRVCNSSCIISKALSTGMHASGLTQRGSSGQYTEPACVDACVNDMSCRSVDYNTDDQSCWYSSIANLPIQSQSLVNHWEITRTNC